MGLVLSLLSLLAANTVHHYEYGYDKAGNRTYARVTQATIGGTAHDNDRSYLYGYDQLQRLILAHMGRLATDNQSILPNEPDVALRRKLEWYPDSLGNWSGLDEVTVTDKGLRRTDKTPGNDPTVTQIRHEVDAFNKITGVNTDGQTVAHVNDSAGNLVFDGSYVYQYDAWNRLVEVNEAGTLTVDDFTSDGKISPTGDPIHQIGDLVVRFRYDGVGRLMLAEWLHTDPPEGPPTFRTEHYYYDGVRRVQEIDDNATPTNAADDLTQHEYVYGPGYVDEFVLESQKTASGQQTLYILQDANYNVMALLDEDGDVVEQYQWEPYGSLAAKDTDTSGTIPHSHIGHQGLFFYRFDDASGPPIALNATGLYHNRNRWYSPRLGRFTSRDPNETAQSLVTALLMNAQSVSLLFDAFSPDGHFLDGMSLYQYLGSNPLVWRDPSGLNGGLLTGRMVVSGTLAILMTIGVGIIGEETGAFDALRDGFELGIMGMRRGAVDLYLEGIELLQMGSYATSESLLLAATELTIFASEQAAALKKIKQLLDTLRVHAGYMATGGPDDPDDNHHRREIKAYLDKIKGKINSLKGKTYDMWNTWVQEFEEWLVTTLGEPPVPPTGWY